MRVASCLTRRQELSQWDAASEKTGLTGRQVVSQWDEVSEKTGPTRVGTVCLRRPLSPLAARSAVGASAAPKNNNIGTQLCVRVVDINGMLRSNVRSLAPAADRVALAWHVTCRLADDRAIARTPEELRLASGIIKRHGEPRGLLAYSVGDTHSHHLLACDRVAAGRFALFSETALRKRLRLPVSFEAARIRPVETPRHALFSLRYVFQQAAHHRSAFDLALDGSSLPELVGMRSVDGSMARRVRELLPRLSRAQILEWLGAPGFDACDTNPRLIVEATAGAFLLPTLSGTGAREARARTAAVHVLGDCIPRPARASFC